MRSKKIHKTSQKLDKPFKFTENSYKIIKKSRMSQKELKKSDKTIKF